MLEEQSSQIQEYTSLEDFKKKRLLQHKSGLLKGCIDRNGALGTIKVRPFSLSIKSLDSDFEFSRNFKPNQWSKLAGIMQRQSIERPENPKQLIDKICSMFVKHTNRCSQTKTEIPFPVDSVLKASKEQRVEMLTSEQEID